MSNKLIINPKDVLLFGVQYPMNLVRDLSQNFREWVKKKDIDVLYSEIFSNEVRHLPYERFVLYNSLNKKVFHKVFNQNEYDKWKVKELYYLKHMKISPTYNIIGTLFSKKTKNILGYFSYSFLGKLVKIPPMEFDYLFSISKMELNNPNLIDFIKTFEKSKEYVDEVLIIPPAYISDKSNLFKGEYNTVVFDFLNFTELNSLFKEEDIPDYSSYLSDYVRKFGRKMFNEHVRRRKDFSKISSTLNSNMYPYWVHKQTEFIAALPQEYINEIENIMAMLMIQDENQKNDLDLESFGNTPSDNVTIH